METILESTFSWNFGHYRFPNVYSLALENPKGVGQHLVLATIQKIPIQSEN
ncbi:hypothetical protein FD42_GL001866 [Lentilactobacillus hilgardii DSM 20176 = ATCC 8290]|nr:hypothetical protein FD42_GL001866 [Lentilactobacillus hilgardii DSM 20176 = ATCC 8290]